MTSENQPLHTEQWESAHGGARRALLLHGITSSAATMWELGEGLAAAGWSAVAVDLPGHGSSGAAASYRFADVAQVIETQVGAGWDLIVGHSLGGAIATVLLASNPTFANRALLIDPALFVPDGYIDAFLPTVLRDQVEQNETLVAAAHPHWHPRTVAERVRSTQATDVVAAGGYPAQNRPWDVRADARKVRTPVHVLIPSDEALMTSDIVDELSTSTRPLWTFETVPDTTHALHRDQPAVVVDRAVRPAG